jgi:hypothetical protein
MLGPCQTTQKTPTPFTRSQTHQKTRSTPHKRRCGIGGQTQHTLLTLKFFFSIFCGAILYSQGLQASKFEHPAIKIRANTTAALNIPARSYFGLENPLLSDDNSFFIKFDSWDGDARTGIFRWSDEYGPQHFFTPEGTFASGLALDTHTQKLYYELVNYGYFSQGIHRIDALLKKSELVFLDNKRIFSSNVKVLENNQSLIFRGSNANQSQDIVKLSLDPQKHTDILLETAHQRPQEEIAYIFPPAANEHGLMAFKVRHGAAGELNEAQKDSIRIYNTQDNSLQLMHEIWDRDADPKSPFLSFDNTVSINASGEVLFVTKLSSGPRAIYKWKPTQGLQELVREGEFEGLDEIPFFAPDMNNAGEVVFRARSKSLGESVWHISAHNKLTRLMAWGDRIKSDLGWARVGDKNKNVMHLYLAPRINNLGSVLIGTLIHQDDDNSSNKGLGFYLLTSLADADAGQ